MNKTAMTASILLFAFCAAWLPAFAQAVEPSLEQVIERFDQAQDELRTITANFEETTTNPLLAEPIVSHGKFFMTKPNSIRWEYDRPEEMQFVIHSDRYTGYFPTRNRAEQRSIKRWSERIFRFIGLGQGSQELSKFYDIRLGTEPERAAGGDPEDRLLLVFEPRKRRIKKRVEVVRFWVDRDDYLPRRVEYLGNDGAERILSFDSVTLNPDLAAGLYEMQLPEGVTMTEGFSGLPGIQEPSAN